MGNTSSVIMSLQCLVLVCMHMEQWIGNIQAPLHIQSNTIGKAPKVTGKFDVWR